MLQCLMQLILQIIIFLAEDYNKPINSVLVRNVKSNVEYNKNIESLPISSHFE